MDLAVPRKEANYSAGAPPTHAAPSRRPDPEPIPVTVPRPEGEAQAGGAISGGPRLCSRQGGPAGARTHLAGGLHGRAAPEAFAAPGARAGCAVWIPLRLWSRDPVCDSLGLPLPSELAAETCGPLSEFSLWLPLSTPTVAFIGPQPLASEAGGAGRRGGQSPGAGTEACPGRGSPRRGPRSPSRRVRGGEGGRPLGTLFWLRISTSP